MVFRAIPGHKDTKRIQPMATRAERQQYLESLDEKGWESLAQRFGGLVYPSVVTTLLQF